jgi:hypothetical protein
MRNSPSINISIYVILLHLFESRTIDLCITKGNKIKFETKFSGTYTAAFSRGFLDNQTSFMEKGTQELALGTNLTERRINGLEQFPGVFGKEVSEFDEFAVRPDKLNWIKFRGIGRQPFRTNIGIVFAEELADGFSLMDFSVVHDEYLFSGDASSDATQEFQDFFRRDVVGINAKEEIEPPALWRNGNSADNREPVASLPVFENRGLAFRRPCLSDDGLEHKTRFVNEDNRIFFPSWPSLLPSASSPVSTVLFALRSVLLPCAGAFDSSNLERSGFSTRGKDDILSQTPSRLLPLSFLTSTTGVDTQKPLALSTALFEAEPFVPDSKNRDGVDEAAHSNLFGHLSLVSLSSDILMRLLSQLGLLLLPRSNLVSTTASPVVFAFPVLWESLGVSYWLLYMNFALFGSANINKTLTACTLSL